VENVSDTLNVLAYIFLSVVDRKFHCPFVAFSGSVLRFRVVDHFMGISVCEPNQTFCIVISTLDELLLCFQILLTHLHSDLLLEFFVNNWYEKGPIEGGSAHRTRHAFLNNCLLALEAKHVITRREHWLDAETPTYRALVIL